MVKLMDIEFLIASRKQGWNKIIEKTEPPECNGSGGHDVLEHNRK